MSKETIYREDAIKAVWGEDINPSEDGVAFEAQSHIDRDIRLIPSADRPLKTKDYPPTAEVQNILDFLDTELHPIVSPEHWGVYSELHDMISLLPSADRPQREWIEHEWAEEVEGLLISNYECSKCHSWERRASDFCPNCGADMRGEK